jgi:hypothetical protein
VPFKKLKYYIIWLCTSIHLQNVIVIVFLEDVKFFHPHSYESSLTASEGDVSHLRLRRGMSEEVQSAHNCNGECYAACHITHRFLVRVYALC